VTTVSPVSVPVGGIVTNSGAAAISVAVPYLQTGKVAILVAGTVMGLETPASPRRRAFWRVLLRRQCGHYGGAGRPRDGALR
jgi:hypothetical protein